MCWLQGRIPRKCRPQQANFIGCKSVATRKVNPPEAPCRSDSAWGTIQPRVYITRLCLSTYSCSRRALCAPLASHVGEPTEGPTAVARVKLPWRGQQDPHTPPFTWQHCLGRGKASVHLWHYFTACDTAGKDTTRPAQQTRIWNKHQPKYKVVLYMKWSTYLFLLPSKTWAKQPQELEPRIKVIHKPAKFPEKEIRTINAFAGCSSSDWCWFTI